MVRIHEGTQKWIKRVVTTGMISSTTLHARVAQSVEHDLAKVRVASSNLVSRSIRESRFKVKDMRADDV